MRRLFPRAVVEPGWAVALCVATAWALLPLVPALRRGELPGSPYTDLYPSVWGLGWFAAEQPGLPDHTSWLGAPAGMPFYYSSPLHGWFGAPFVELGGAALAYVVTLLLARAASVAVAFGALRALGAGGWGALAGALLYGASPYLHGFAAEGIVEGTDGWALAAWAWAGAVAASTRPPTASRAWPVIPDLPRLALVAACFAVTVVSSWYAGMVACLLALGAGLRAPRVGVASFAGLLLAAPMLLGFLGMAGETQPLSDALRAAMGAPLAVRPPALWQPQSFALTTWVGVSTLVLCLPSVPRRPLVALGVVACFLLSLGRGPWYHLPVFEAVRFPYRWHLGTTACLALLLADTVDRLRQPLWGLLPWLEGFLLSPIPPLLPGAPADVPAIYDQVRGPLLLEVPGPVAMPPGEINRSRPRARYLLYFQLHHRAASPWAPDFNGVAATPGAPWLAGFAAWDPLVTPVERVEEGLALPAPPPPDLAAAAAAGVTQVMVHRDELGPRADSFVAALQAQGAVEEGREGRLMLFRLPEGVPASAPPDLPTPP